MDEDVREGEICDGIVVDTLVEIWFISDERLLQTVVPVKHAGDSVETESVDMVFLHPVLAVGEKEVFCLILSVVEAARTPCRMAPLPSVVEVEGLLSVEVSEAFGFIVDRMRMNYVHDHGDAEAMSLVHKSLELLRSTEARAEGEEVRHLIAERTIVRMLLESHYLERVISEVGDLRKHVGTELLECSHLLLLRSHADMAFVDQRMLALSRLRILPLVRNSIPHLGAESLGHRILDSPCGIGRKPFRSASLPLYVKLVEHSVLKEHRRQHDLPVSASERLHGICLCPFPVVELSDQIYLGRIRSPLAEHPVPLVVTVHPIEHMVVHALAQGSVHRHPLLEVHDHLMPSIDDILVRHQPLIVVINHFLLLFCAHIFPFYIFSTFSRTPRSHARHASMSSSDLLMYLSMSSMPVCGSSTLAAMDSSSSTAFV